MKILLFTNCLAGGGAERVVATLANHWVRGNWQVTVVTLAPSSDDFYTLDPHVRRIALDLSARSRGPVHALYANLRRMLALRRVLVELRPTVALAMMSTPNVLLALASRGLPGLCAIGSERCYPPHFPLGRAWRFLSRMSYGWLYAIVAQTEDSATWISANTSARRVPVIPNAALWPLPQHEPRIAPEALCPAGRQVLLAVGRLETVKNFGVLVDAFVGLAGAHPAWDLVILGEGPQRAALERAVLAAGAGGRIFLPGLAGNVGEWHARAGLFAMCSLSEGFPNALAEALAHGVPAVSVDCETGPRDIIRHGCDGLLVPPGDETALARALGRLMGDAGLRAEFAAQAREARNRFSLERVAGMWETLFRESAARGQRLCSRGRALRDGAGS